MIEARHQRLHQGRGQPELINDNMDNWVEFLEKQAINANTKLLDTSLINKEKTSKQRKQWIDDSKRI